MERLNSDQRKKVWMALMEIVKSVYSFDLSYSYIDICLRELQTYSISSRLCVLMADKMGLNVEKGQLIEIETSVLKAFHCCDEMGEDNGELLKEQVKAYEAIDTISESFLYSILAQTSWEVYMYEDIYDLDLAEDEELKRIADQIPSMMAPIREEERFADKADLCKLEERFNSLGIDSSDGIEGFERCRILDIENRVLKKAVKLCERHPDLVNLPEAAEIIEYGEVSLFDRTFPSLYSDLAGGYVYVLGDYISDRLETSDMYYLSWPAVLGLVLMEWAAQDLLDRAKKEGIAYE